MSFHMFFFLFLLTVLLTVVIMFFCFDFPVENMLSNGTITSLLIE